MANLQKTETKLDRAESTIERLRSRFAREREELTSAQKRTESAIISSATSAVACVATASLEALVTEDGQISVGGVPVVTTVGALVSVLGIAMQAGNAPGGDIVRAAGDGMFLPGLYRLTQAAAKGAAAAAA